MNPSTDFTAGKVLSAGLALKIPDSGAWIDLYFPQLKSEFYLVFSNADPFDCFRAHTHPRFWDTHIDDYRYQKARAPLQTLTLKLHKVKNPTTAIVAQAQVIPAVFSRTARTRTRTTAAAHATETFAT